MGRQQNPITEAVVSNAHKMSGGLASPEEKASRRSGAVSLAFTAAGEHPRLQNNSLLAMNSVLRRRMNHPSLLDFAVALTLIVTPAASQEPCLNCKEPTPMTIRERIKAERDAFDLEMKRDSRRPWDGMEINGRKLRSTPALSTSRPESFYNSMKIEWFVGLNS